MRKVYADRMTDNGEYKLRGGWWREELPRGRQKRGGRGGDERMETPR